MNPDPNLSKTESESSQNARTQLEPLVLDWFYFHVVLKPVNCLRIPRLKHHNFVCGPTLFCDALCNR